MSQRVLVIAPHPDDEVLGVGGTIAKLAAEGAWVEVVIVTKASPPLYTEDVLVTGRREARAAQRTLGASRSRFLSFPAAGLDSVPHSELNAGLGEVFAEGRPEVVFIPFNGDMHTDHQLVFTSAMVCSRPGSAWSPRSIYAYETLSETNWNAPYVTPNFVPNVFVDITAHLETKLAAMRQYASQLKDFPHERSIGALEALAARRGSTVGVAAAEAFVLVRDIR
ncbi:MAG: PIG-L family deacetylase [Actinomycetota bacterium]|nr:PIG-L family deacetylase [Actinomycetota bacterium]MDP9020452.1 PIG-L family deacetylase [Actinomycetota bacterium]